MIRLELENNFIEIDTTQEEWFFYDIDGNKYTKIVKNEADKNEAMWSVKLNFLKDVLKQNEDEVLENYNKIIIKEI